MLIPNQSTILDVCLSGCKDAPLILASHHTNYLSDKFWVPKCIDQFTTGSKGHIDDIGLSLHNHWWELAVGKRCLKFPKEQRVPKGAQKNPAYGRHWISRPMWIVGLIQFWIFFKFLNFFLLFFFNRGCVIFLIFLIFFVLEKLRVFLKKKK